MASMTRFFLVATLMLAPISWADIPRVDDSGEGTSEHVDPFPSRERRRSRGSQKPPRPVPSEKLDCAIRHLAMEFAMDTLSWRSVSQERHIADALRLQECPLNNAPLPKDDKHDENHQEKPKHSFQHPRQEPPQTLRSSRRRTTKDSSTTASAKEPPIDWTPEQLQDTLGSSSSGIDKVLRVYVDPIHGSDDGSSGSLTRPLRSLRAAIDLARKTRQKQSPPPRTTRIILRGGRYFLQQTLRLDSRDSGTSLVAYPGETPVLSGGDPLSLTLRPTAENPSVYVGYLDSRTERGTGKPSGTEESKSRQADETDSPYNFTLLFLDRAGQAKVETNRDDDDDVVRLVWAREPNGHPEKDLQPTGYARADGPDDSGRRWPDPAGSVHAVVTQPRRNSTVYPFHGESAHRGRGDNWLQYGGTANRFVDGKAYWSRNVPMGLKVFNHTLNTSGWTTEGTKGSVAHVFQNALWGNWQFEIDTVISGAQLAGDGSEESSSDSKRSASRVAAAEATNATETQITFKRGGWQEARGGRIERQAFFVEGVREALDAPGEWWLDVPDQALYYYPFGNETSNSNNKNNNTSQIVSERLKLDFIAPRLHRLIEIVGENSDDRVAKEITLHGLTFSQTATTFLEPYENPSPGDWSVHRGGAVLIENSRVASIEECKFLRTGGNAVVLSGYTKKSHILRNEFAWIGDSAIVSIGRIVQADGFTVDTYPEDTVIENNYFREIGIHGKQTSALFSALSCKTTFSKNVLYNGPRAGINLNDQFCHGHTIRENLIFNWVRETEDHGPINTWDRAMYIQKGESTGADGQLITIPTPVPSWTHIEGNFIMNGPSAYQNPSWFPTIDNDDGSSYFYMAKNVLVYGGAKNYLGHDKLWISNLIVHPGRWSGYPCAYLGAGKNHWFAHNICLVARGDRPLYLGGSMGGCKIDWNDPENNLAFVAKTANNSYYLDDDDSWGFNCGNETSPQHRFTMEELQKHGQELGSTVQDSNLLTVERVIELAKGLLEME